MCFVIAFGVISLTYLLLSFIEFRFGLTSANARPPADQFNGHLAWHFAVLPEIEDDHVTGGL